METIRKFTTHKTKETVFKNEIIRIILLTIFAVLLTTVDILFIELLTLRIIVTLIVCILYYGFLLSIFRLIAISENKNKLNKTININKYKWESFTVIFDTLINIISKINVSITFDALVNKKNIEFGVLVDVDLKTKFYYIEDYKVGTIIDFRNQLLGYLPIDGNVTLYAIDNNNPETYWNKLIKIIL